MNNSSPVVRRNSGHPPPLIEPVTPAALVNSIRSYQVGTVRLQPNQIALFELSTSSRAKRPQLPVAAGRRLRH